MASRTSLIVTNDLRRRTVNDTVSFGVKSFGDNKSFTTLTVTGSSNASINGEYSQSTAHNSTNTYVKDSLTIYYTGKFWAINTSVNDDYWTALYTCPAQLGIYKQVGGSDGAMVFGSGNAGGTLISSNGQFAVTYLTSDVLTINQARLFFDAGINAVRLDILSDNTVALVFVNKGENLFAVPSGDSTNYAIQTFKTLLVGANTTNIETAGFDSINSNACLGVKEWIYTSNFRTDNTHYTDNLTPNTTLNIAGIEHNTHLGVQINTPATRPSWGQNGQAVFAENTRKLSIRYNPSTPNYPEFPDWRTLGNMYQEYMDAMDAYKDYYVRNRTESLSVETINLTTNIGSGSANPIYSAMRLSDGSCYYPSAAGNSSLWVESDGSPNTVTGNNLRQYDSTLCPLDDKIYLSPTSTSAIRTQETSNWTPVTANTIPGGNYANDYFIGSVIADDGTVHFLPGSKAPEAVKYDPTTNVVSLYGTASTGNGSSWAQITQLNHNGNLYALPARGFNTDNDFYIRKVNPDSGSITDIFLWNSTQSSWSCTGYPYKDNIYFARKMAGAQFQLWYFNTTDNSNGSVNTTNTGSLEYGSTGILAPDGCLYISDYGGSLHRIDLTTNTLETILTGLSATCLGLDTGGYLNIVPSNYQTDITFFNRIKLFDVPIDPNFLCNRYLNTS